MAADVREGVLESVDEAKRSAGSGFPQEIRDGLVNVAARLFPGNGRLQFSTAAGSFRRSADPGAKFPEVGFIGRCRRRRGRAFEQQAPHALAVLIFANQLPHVFAARAVATQRLNLASEIRWYGPGKLLVIVDCVESL